MKQVATMYQNFLFHIYVKLNMFRTNTAHHQEPTTALSASGFSYVEGCWTCSWWTFVRQSTCLTMSTNYTSNNFPHMKNQSLQVQF
jgi:hypothetical protein